MHSHHQQQFWNYENYQEMTTGTPDINDSILQGNACTLNKENNSDANHANTERSIDAYRVSEDSVTEQFEKKIPIHRIKKRKRYTNAYGFFFQEIYRQLSKPNKPPNFFTSSF